MASDRANPRIAYEKSCCLSEGFLAYPMMRDPNTDPIPAPDPATPTVAAPAPINLAAESISDLGAEVCMACTELQDLELGLDQCSDPSSLDTPGTPHSSSSFSHTLFWDSPCPRPWVCSV